MRSPHDNPSSENCYGFSTATVIVVRVITNEGNCYWVVVKEGRGTRIRPYGNAIPFHMKPSPTRSMKRQRVAISAITANEHSIDVIINFIVVSIHRSGAIVWDRPQLSHSTTFSLKRESVAKFRDVYPQSRKWPKASTINSHLLDIRILIFRIRSGEHWGWAGPRLILWEIVV